MSFNEKNNTRVKIQKKRKFRRRLLFILIPFLLLVAGVGTWAANIYFKAEKAISESYTDDGREKSELRVEKVHPKFDNVSILIMGIDASDHRENHDSARTDALILATLNKEDKSVKLHSIPRDTYVYIPERGFEDKINHAHAFGGHESTIETVENLLDIPVDYWIKLNFKAFVDVVDALNGVEVEVPYEFRESDSNDKRDSIHLLPGQQILNGEEALAFARTRKHDNDVERGKRQIEIVKSVADKATSLSSLTKIDDMIEAVGDNMETNISPDEMRGFIHYGTNGRNLSIDSYSLEGTDYQPGSIYYYQLDEVALNETKEMLKKHLELPDANDGTSEGNLELTEEAESATQPAGN
ncbi:MAG TPA: LCP family protein [Bacillota bacterium]|nr:LCP family protein [Bacillota bacterium]